MYQSFTHFSRQHPLLRSVKFLEERLRDYTQGNDSSDLGIRTQIILDISQHALVIDQALRRYNLLPKLSLFLREISRQTPKILHDLPCTKRAQKLQQQLTALHTHMEKAFQSFES